MEAIILAGGFGTRLQQVVKDVPKPMALINGKPFLEYQLNYLKHYGISKVIFSVGYLHQQISDHFKNSFQNIEIEYAVENEPLGTGGGIKLSLSETNDETILVLNGDTLFDVNLSEMIDFHQKNNSEFTIALRYLPDVSRYGSVEMDEKGRIWLFVEKFGKTGEGYINGGIYLFNRYFFDNLGLTEKFSLEKDVLEKVVEKRKIFGFKSNDYFLDIGVPEDYEKAQDEFKRFEY